MISIDSLRKVVAGLKDRLGKMHLANNALNAQIDAFTRDTTRSARYIEENIAQARTDALPGMGDELRAMKEAAANVAPHRPLWADRALLLSAMRFDADPAVHAAIRSDLRAEYAAMDAPTLQHVVESALLDQGVAPNERNLAVVWAATQAAKAAGYGDLVDLTTLTIPQQREALALIDSMDAYLAEAELLVAGTTGARTAPLQKLTIGHRIAAGTGKPTHYNSPGRPVPGV